jgi:Holliday junction resolvase RusA-like endonuclease
VTLSFEIVGRVPSNNRVARRVGNKTLKSAEARDFCARIYSHAMYAANAAGWERPAACRVEIVAWNTRLDVDNVPKCILDGMAGMAYENDKCVLELEVRKERDRGEQRTAIRVVALDASGARC